MRHKDTPCAGCPWLRTNQTPAAVAASPVDGRGVHWFAAANIMRHWRAAATRGVMLPCHVTDENAALYGGSFTRKQDARICVGLSTLAHREVTLFMQAGQNFTRYREIPGKRFTAVGLAAWAARLLYAGAVFTISGRNFRMPTITDSDTDLCGLPR